MVKKIYQFIDLLSKVAFFLILTPQVLNPIDHGNRRIFIDTKYNLHITMLLHVKYNNIFIPGSWEDFFPPNFATYMYFKHLTTMAWKPNTLGHNLIKLLIYMFHIISYIYSNAVTVYVNLWTQGPRPHRHLGGLVFIWAGFYLYITMKIHVIYNSIS